MTVSAGEPEAPVERRPESGRPVRVALVQGRDPRHRLFLAGLVLATGAQPVLVVQADERGQIVEVAQRLRDSSCDAVVIAGDAADGPRLALVLEALRLGCASREPRPAVLAFVEPPVAERLRRPARPFTIDVLSDTSAAIGALRALRRGPDATARLRDEVLEDAARTLAGSTRRSAVVVDVTERSTSCVIARADGSIEAAHAAGCGVGASGDRVVAEVGIDAVRRWLPWPIDNPGLLERVYNRAGWPGAVPASDLALAIDMAVAREAIGLAVRRARDAGLDVAEMRAAPNALVTGHAAELPRPAQTLVVLVDGLQPTGVVSVLREADGRRPERIGLLATVRAGRSTRVKLVTTSGQQERSVERGSLLRVPLAGEVALSGGGVRAGGTAAGVGVLIDARGRPLALPNRDAERLPLVARWHLVSGALGTS